MSSPPAHGRSACAWRSARRRARCAGWVVSQGARVVLADVVIGVGAALASTRLLGALLFGVKAVDAAVFAAMSLRMIAIGMMASYMPARRASSVDPIESLRSDQEVFRAGVVRARR